MSGVLASVTYECKTKNGYPFGLTVDLVKSRDDDYGNKHYLIIYEETYDYSLDARYDVRFNTVEGFYENILDVLKERYAIAEAKLTLKE